MDPTFFKTRIQSVNTQAANAAFISEVESLFQYRPLTVLDIGAFQGALVQGFLHRGHRAIGLEIDGQKNAAWKTLSNTALFTADISHPFSIKNQNQEILQFDLIIGIQIADLISPEELSLYFASIRRHLKLGGLFIGSISLRDHFPQNRQIQLWQNYNLKILNGLQFINYPFNQIPYPIFTSFYYGLISV